MARIPLKVFIMDVTDGTTYYVRAKNRGDADRILQDRMVDLYGHRKAYRIRTATQKDVEDYPIIFRPKRSEWKAMSNPDKCQYDKTCRGKASYMVMTKSGDFLMCATHANKVKDDSSVRYIERLK